MPNPNPYKDIRLPPWWLEALERGDVEKIKRYAQFCLHGKRKFERAAAREYARNVKLRRQLQDHGITPILDI